MYSARSVPSSLAQQRRGTGCGSPPSAARRHLRALKQQDHASSQDGQVFSDRRVHMFDNPAMSTSAVQDVKGSSLDVDYFDGGQGGECGGNTVLSARSGCRGVDGPPQELIEDDGTVYDNDGDNSPSAAAMPEGQIGTTEGEQNTQRGGALTDRATNRGWTSTNMSKQSTMTLGSARMPQGVCSRREHFVPNKMVPTMPGGPRSGRGARALARPVN